MRQRWHRLRDLALLAGAAALAVLAVGPAAADILGKENPNMGTVPNPGTQQQELANITFPAPYNVFEFVVTCAACHGGTVDQNAGHFGNWAGTAMASAARDPVFRANNRIVNEAVKRLTGDDGAGNMCFRCHSPNGWYSGRFDPKLAGMADASNMLHSIVLSTDDEGIMCEMCHRVIGGVTMKRSDLDGNDPVWRMMAGIDDWPHSGNDYPEGPLAGDPYGDTTLQLNDGMTYGAKYPGSAEIWFSDVPNAGGSYTGQTYGTLPDGTTPKRAPDGSYPVHAEYPIGPTLDPVTGLVMQAFSPEHTTFGGPAGVNGKPHFLLTPEFCGACHDLSIPVLNQGMPEQRTFTEWKYSDFGRNYYAGQPGNRCQDCHMPTLKHEYADDIPVSLNPDPVVSGWDPYAKDRNPWGGTAFHKFAGSNRDLPRMMKFLYKDVRTGRTELDLEVIGEPTGNDTRIFPGMLSNRDSMFDRYQRNAEIMLRQAVTAQIIEGPIALGGNKYRVTVKVTNHAGHRLPSGYPDGRRLWLGLTVKNATGQTVYQSGYYDPDTAELYNDAGKTGLSRALDPVIDATTEGNQVMIYEKRTGTLNPATGKYEMSVSLLNDTILFDNRIPPQGFDKEKYAQGGARFVTYNPVTTQPVTDMDRFTDNTDTVTYIFSSATPPTSAEVKVYWQTHTKEFMLHLRDGKLPDGTSVWDVDTVRPEGPPSRFELNYPLVPNYLSEQINLASIVDPFAPVSGKGKKAKPAPLKDNWGGVAYASWLKTGMGAPYVVAADSTQVTTAPAAPAGINANRVIDPATGLNDPFTLLITWSPVANADGYELWVRYGADATGNDSPDWKNAGRDPNATASWDRLAVLPAGTTSFRHEALNVNKTYQYRVVAFNGKGEGPPSAVATARTPWDLPLEPLNLRLVSVKKNSVTISWYDQADNETGWIIQRQDALAGTPYVEIARIPSTTLYGGVSYTDSTVRRGRTYNYRVAAYNASGMSVWSTPPVAVIVR